MNPFKKIDFEYAATKFVRDYVMVFAASSVWEQGNPGLSGIAAAAVASVGIAVFRVGRDIFSKAS